MGVQDSLRYTVSGSWSTAPNDELRIAPGGTRSPGAGGIAVQQATGGGHGRVVPRRERRLPRITTMPGNSHAKRTKVVDNILSWTRDSRLDGLNTRAATFGLADYVPTIRFVSSNDQAEGMFSTRTSRPRGHS